MINELLYLRNKLLFKYFSLIFIDPLEDKLLFSIQ